MCFFLTTQVYVPSLMALAVMLMWSSFREMYPGREYSRSSPSLYQLSGGEDGEQHENAPPQRLPGRVVLVQGRLEEGGRGEEEAHDTHDTLPFFAAIFFPHRKVRFLPSATSLVLVRGGVGVAATVGKGNSGEEK